MAIGLNAIESVHELHCCIKKKREFFVEHLSILITKTWEIKSVYFASEPRI